MTAPVPMALPVLQGASHPRALSFSAIRTYQTCPLRYYFKYICGLPEEAVSTSLVFGSAIHRALEHHFRALLAGEARPSLEQLLAHYRAEWREREEQGLRCGTEESSQFDELASRMLVAFQNDAVAVPAGRILGVEEELRGAISPALPEFVGRVDLVTETPEALVVSDWKTSRSRWSSEQVQDAQEQLLLYADLARDFAPGKHVQLELVVVTKTKSVAVERHTSQLEPRRLDRTKRTVERVWQALSAGHFYPAPSLTSCPGCPFRDPCRSWQG